VALSLATAFCKHLGANTSLRTRYEAIAARERLRLGSRLEGWFYCLSGWREVECAQRG
jgi:hypothetical protein